MAHPSAADTPEELTALASDHGLGRLAENIANLSLPAVRLETTDRRTASFVGGPPTASESGPTANDGHELTRLVCVDLSELAGTLEASPLPPSGWMTFYADLRADGNLLEWSETPGNNGAAAVTLSPESSPMPSAGYLEMTQALTITHPDLANERWDMTPQEHDGYFDLWSIQNGLLASGPPETDVPFIQMLGHPRWVQGPLDLSRNQVLLLECCPEDIVGENLATGAETFFIGDAITPSALPHVHVQL